MADSLGISGAPAVSEEWESFEDILWRLRRSAGKKQFACGQRRVSLALAILKPPELFEKTTHRVRGQSGEWQVELGLALEGGRCDSLTDELSEQVDARLMRVALGPFLRSIVTKEHQVSDGVGCRTWRACPWNSAVHMSEAQRSRER